MRGTNLLQSSVWADFNRQLKHNVYEANESDYHYVAIIEHGQLSNRLYCPLGPEANDISGLKSALDKLQNTAKGKKLDFVSLV